MNIAVCDKEKNIREELRDELIRLDSSAKIKDFSSGDDLLKSEDNFDMILLDIQPEGLNGIEIARKVRDRDRDIIIIFMSAVKKYVFEAFDVGAFNYLLKPINPKKLSEVYNSALLVQKSHSVRPEKLLLKTKKKSISITMGEIIYVESQLKKLVIHTFEQCIEFYGSMREIEERLDERFYRCHRGYLVNMDYITEYTRDSIRISNGEMIYLSKDKYTDFEKCYTRYIK